MAFLPKVAQLVEHQDYVPEGQGFESPLRALFQIGSRCLFTVTARRNIQCVDFGVWPLPHVTARHSRSAGSDTVCVRFVDVPNTLADGVLVGNFDSVEWRLRLPQRITGLPALSLLWKTLVQLQKFKLSIQCTVISPTFIPTFVGIFLSGGSHARPKRTWGRHS